MSKFYKIRNADGKCWWMPVRGMRVGLALYQPSGWKGRLLKCLLPWLHWSWLVRKALRIEREEWVMPEEVRRVVCEAFGVREFDYSVFGGTPSVHQKTTIQVWKEDRILGYVKLTESEEVGRLFFREAEFLRDITDNRLQITDNTDICVEKSRRDDRTQTGVQTPGRELTPPTNPVGVTGLVPEARAFRVRNVQVFVLIQTTRKSLRSEMVREWGELQESFLDRLYDATVQEIEWVESDLAKSLCDLREHIDWLPNGVDGEAVVKRIDAVVEHMKGKRVRYGAYHGDFTPWNMFVERGELFVFDWEYAGWGYPKGLDRYHFWMQTAIFEKHWGVEELRRYMCSVDGEWIDGEMLEMYVLDVMSKYVMREGEKVKEMGLFGIWCSLLKEL